MTDRPYVSFTEVKEKVTIPDAMEAFGIRDQFTEKSGVLTGVCPLPQHQHGPQPNRQQFKADAKKGRWLYKCFGDCAMHDHGGGDVIAFVKAMTQTDDAHVRFWFAERFSDRLTLKKNGRANETATTEQEPEQATSDPPTTPTEVKPLRFYLNLDGKSTYLQERGVTASTIERYGIGLCTKGVLNGYVAMPVYRWPKESADENPVGYVGRWPGDDWNDDDRPRYKIPGGFEVSRVVYGLEQALAEGNEQTPLLVVEGPFKVFHLVQYGFPNCISTFTSSLSEEHAEILVSTGRPIVLLFDGNEAGYAGMRTAAAKLITRTFVRVVKLDAGVEPDHLSGEQLDALIGFAKPLKKLK